ncbi:protein FAN-like isoform X2 [Episyrphus balteatus]|uniref:protein FAN-like isoform X2 n=1 Tax=Episyrphus balteatus TaxID=286459 RepID=UPI002486800D|nr:protein FAN-like isoform X2 [Episyrphus balteatus]
MDKQRFSLLLLDPNEIYFEDFSVDLLPQIKSTKINDAIINNDDSNPIQGRLKMCSKSLLFEPKKKQIPLIKMYYSKCSTIATDNENNQQNLLNIRCSQYVELLENNVIAPYKFVNCERSFRFVFHYVKVDDDVIPLLQQLQRASSLPNLEQSSMIAAIVYSLQKRIKFDPLWLNSIYEKIVVEYNVNEVNPLVLNPARILLTNSFIYLQHYNNIQSEPVIKIKLDSVTSFTKRRFLLRHIGLEIYWNHNQHLYVSFKNVIDRNNFISLVEEQSDFKPPNIEQHSMTLKWQNRLISNYQYLLYLNGLADRSFKDLTQYPVFPWVITDYTSETLNLNDESIYRDLKKPIGALNAERLKRLKERYEEMDEPKYLYGSHYSTPGFILFYLVRKYPHLMLCLQNGRFDHPDRMFNSVQDSFNNCITNMADFKELIPEFYDTSQGGDFLLNSYKINFGQRFTGASVNHVQLPPWAKNSPSQFISKLREALESEYVSENLHHWIDLIFGYCQKGSEAVSADNVFYHLSYEGSVDLDSVNDPVRRHALEIQISEFGQIPTQLFDKPHVSRNSKIKEKTDESPEKESQPHLELKYSYSGHKESITSILVDDDTVVSTGKDGLLKCYSLKDKRQTRSISFGKLPISSCVKMTDSNSLVVGSWDNNINLYKCDYGKVSDVIPAHEDSVSCLSLDQDLGILASGSWDCSVKVWKGFKDLNGKMYRLSNSMLAQYEFDCDVMGLCTKKTHDQFQVIIGTKNGDIWVWTFDLDVISLTDGVIHVTDMKTGMNLFKKKLDSTPISLSWNENDYLINVNDDGFIYIWDLVQVKLYLYEQIFKGPISIVTSAHFKNDELIITAGKDLNEYKIKCWVISTT